MIIFRSLSLKLAVALAVLVAPALAETPADLPAELQDFSLSKQAARDMPGWRKPGRILLTLSDAIMNPEIEAELKGVDVVAIAGTTLPADLSGDFDAIFTWCASPEVLNAISNTHYVHSYSAGVEKCLAHPKVIDSPNLVISNSRGAAAVTIAEHAISLMMALGRGLPYYRDQMSQQRWDRSALGRQNLISFNGKTLLVLGLGRIGTETARRAHGLGMRVIATRNSRREGPDFVDQVGLPGETLELAAQADAVINALPLTASTRHIVDQKFFQALPSEAIFVNVGRGATVDTQALITALEEKQIAAAGLDVTDPEPLPADSKLWKMNNVLITPHIAGRSAESMALTVMIARENLLRYLRGDRLINPVSREKAY